MYGNGERYVKDLSSGLARSRPWPNLSFASSERIIGACLADLTEQERTQVAIATKWLPLPTPRNPFLFKPGLVKGLKKSLARLSVDSVALYQVRPAPLLILPGPEGQRSWAR